MPKFYKIFLLLSLVIFSTTSYAHVAHYNKIKIIEFDIYRNNKNIGKHTFSFKRENLKLEVRSEINFKIKKFGAVLYRYKAVGTEIYEDGKLIKFNSNTKQNRKEKFVNINIENNEYVIDGSSYKGKAPIEYLIGTWWNHSIVEAPAQISAVSGRIIKQKVTFIGKETVKFGEKTFDALHFNFSSTDQKLSKNKKLNTDVWYDEKNLNWIKASFNKKGHWEYKIVRIE